MITNRHLSIGYPDPPESRFTAVCSQPLPQHGWRAGSIKKGCCTCRRRKRGVKIVRCPYYPVLPAPSHSPLSSPARNADGSSAPNKHPYMAKCRNAGMPVWCAGVNTSGSGSKAGSIVGESLLRWEACFDQCSLTNLDRRSWQYRRGNVRSGVNTYVDDATVGAPWQEKKGQAD